MNQKPMQDDQRVRAHVWVKGRVQGVGFRAHVEYYAGRIGVTGWVRNVGWDTVEAVAEGERDKVERFIEMMKRGPSASQVDESRVEWEEATGEFREFGVRRSM
jgi:acylphosphatase